MEYTPEEVESGEFLRPYIEKLMKGTPKNYPQNLQDLLTASGSNEQLPT